MFVRQKRDVDGLADLRPNTGMNTRYHAYFEAHLTTDQNQQQHPSDKAAVIRYIRRRERQRRAEQNRKNHELTDDTIEKVFSKKNKFSFHLFFHLANSRNHRKLRWNGYEIRTRTTKTK
jgi:hypothetical protein